jgi:hypothetical protein
LNSTKVLTTLAAAVRPNAAIDIGKFAD